MQMTTLKPELVKEHVIMYDLIVKNGTIVNENGRFLGDILIKNGKIDAVVKAVNEDQEKQSERIIDAKGLFVLPGFMDPHVHFREPGHTHLEDFSTGSAAAIAGGYTTVFDMPNNIPRTATKEDFLEKLSLIGNRSNVDFALYGIIKPDNLNKIDELIECGARGFKCLMGISSMKTPTSRDYTLWQALDLLKDKGLVISVHAEDTEICDVAKEKLREKGMNKPIAHMLSRPPIAESIAIMRAIMLAEDVGGRLHIAHIAAKESVNIIRAAKARGVRVTCETGPHNLFLTDQDYDRKGTKMFMNPPIRYKEDQDSLIEGIKDGTIDMIATDHAPHSEADKNSSGSFLDSISGCCGLEGSIPIMLTLVNKGVLSLEQIVKICSSNVARMFNLYPQKGSLTVGTDADITIVDMKKSTKLDSKTFHSKTVVSLYDQENVSGMPVYTVLRGQIVMKDSQILTKPIGRFL